MIQKSILNEPKWGRHKQSFVGDGAPGLIVATALATTTKNDNPVGNFVNSRRRVARNSQWGGCFGVLGQSPQLPDANGGLEAKLPAPEAGSLGAKPPAAGGTGAWGRSPQPSKILHFFCKNNFILGLFSLNNNAFKTWVRNWQCKQD